MGMSNAFAANAAAQTAAAAGDWAGALAALAADTTDIVYSELRNARQLMDLLDDADADLVLGTLQAATTPRVISAYDSLNNGGLDFSHPKVQAMIPQVGAAGSWPQPLIDTLMELGVVTKPDAEIEDGQPLTEATVQAGWNAYQQQLLESELATELNETVNPAVPSGRVALVAALRQAADTIEAG